MKRPDLIAHLFRHECRLVWEGGEHSIRENPATNQRTSILRHREILEFTAIRIRRQMGIPLPS